jgi:hypothetical protein
MGQVTRSLFSRFFTRRLQPPAPDQPRVPRRQLGHLPLVAQGVPLNNDPVVVRCPPQPIERDNDQVTRAEVCHPFPPL